MKFKSKKNPLYFIAEIGSNHEGSFIQAKKILNDCLKSRADCVKIQIYTAKNIVSKKQSPERYKHFSRLELNIENYLELAHIANKSNKDFSASIWDKSLIKVFSKYVKFFKIGSGDITNFEIINEITKTGKPLLISTGLSTIKDIKKTIKFTENQNRKYKEKNMISILHCNTAYPTPINNSNLLSIKKFVNIFKKNIGYSDHTIGDFVPLMSYLLGAKIIEKHYSLNPEKKTFRDHQISLDRNGVNDFLNKISSIKKIKIEKKNSLTKSEKDQNNFNIFRRSIYLKKNLKKNEKIQFSDITCLRPFKGICSSEYFNLLGVKVNQNLKKGDPLKKEHIR